MSQCDNVVNGNLTKDSDCDTSSSDSTNIVASNGINSDSDDTKSNQSDDGNDTNINNCTNSDVHKKQVPENKSEKKKIKYLEKNIETNKKKECSKNKSIEETNDVKEDKEKENNKDVNGAVNDCKQDKEVSPDNDDGEEKKQEAEVVFIQDMGFTVKIVSPGAEPLDIQVKSFN